MSSRCPFCNCRSLMPVRDKDMDFLIECGGCVATGPCAKTLEEAWALWNTRSSNEISKISDLLRKYPRLAELHRNDPVIQQTFAIARDGNVSIEETLVACLTSTCEINLKLVRKMVKMESSKIFLPKGYRDSKK